MAAAIAATRDPSSRGERAVRAAASPWPVLAAASAVAAEPAGATNNSSTRFPRVGPSEESAIGVVALALEVLGLDEDERGPDVDGGAAGLPNPSPRGEGAVRAPAAPVPTAPNSGRSPLPFSSAIPLSPLLDSLNPWA